MISFDTEQGRFSVRVAGIAIVDGRVLLHRSVGDTYWVLPGGRMEMMESGQATLAREMIEETGKEFEVGRLVWLMENFFVWREKPFHEIGMYFEMTPRAMPDAWEFMGREGADYLEFRWIPLDELDQLKVQPAFLKGGLRALPEAMTHVVWR